MPGRSWVAALASVALVVAAVGVVHAFATSGDLVGYARAPDDYARLVLLVSQLCEEREPCGVGRGDSDRPPPEVQRAMSAVRARDVVHEPALGWTTIRGDYSAAFLLRYEMPPTVVQQRNRMLERQREAVRPTSQMPPHIDSLGRGWVRVERR